MALEDIPDAVYSYHLVRLRCNDEVVVAYRAHAFSAKYFLDQASVLADGSGTGTQNLQFPPHARGIAPRDEQRRIGTLLTDVETQIATLSELINKKTNIKQGFMQELLTGKTRLSGFESVERDPTREYFVSHEWKRLKHVANETGKYPVLGTGGVMGWADDYLYDQPCVLIGRKVQLTNRNIWKSHSGALTLSFTA